MFNKTRIFKAFYKTPVNIWGDCLWLSFQVKTVTKIQLGIHAYTQNIYNISIAQGYTALVNIVSKWFHQVSTLMLKYLLKTLISFIRIINNFHNQIVKSTAIISYFTRYHARSDISHLEVLWTQISKNLIITIMKTFLLDYYHISNRKINKNNTFKRIYGVFFCNGILVPEVMGPKKRRLRLDRIPQ